MKHLIDTGKNGSFNITSSLKWTDTVQAVNLGKNKTPKSLREEIIADDTGFLPVTVWGSELIKSIVDGETYELSNMIIQMYNGKMKINTTTNTTIKATENTGQTSELTETGDNKIASCNE